MAQASNAPEVDINDVRAVRRAKRQALIDAGVNPYPIASKVTAHAKDLEEKYAGLEAGADTQDVYSLAGRVRAIRGQGKLMFVVLEDVSGKIQLFCRVNDMDEKSWELLRQLDMGDIIQAEGPVVRTRRGELSLAPRSIVLLSKSMRPLPEKFHGLTDREIRYRQRYLDMIMNPEVREVFRKRSRIVSLIRSYMEADGYIEVETPIMHSILGGANAKPFVTHFNALDRDFYLRIATELPLKRLIVGGMERVFEIGRQFRNEGMDLTHNPEFTSMEAYCAYSDLDGMKRLTEGLFQYIAREACGCEPGHEVITFQGQEIDMSGTWDSRPLSEIASEVVGEHVDMDTPVEHLRELCRAHDIEPQGNWGAGKLLFELYDELGEETLVRPTFVCDYPEEVSPLSKRKDDDPRLTDRFELVIAGHEYANAFSELNDPVDQAGRFAEQVAAKGFGDDEAMGYDYDYVRALEYGMPPAGGIGYGIDRMMMLFCDQPSIRDVLLFPQMKPEAVTRQDIAEQVGGARTDNAAADVDSLFSDAEKGATAEVEAQRQAEDAAAREPGDAPAASAAADAAGEKDEASGSQGEAGMNDAVRAAIDATAQEGEALDAGISREKAYELLTTYNRDPFHVSHGETLEGLMRHFAQKYDPANVEFWGLVGLLHDLDWERWQDDQLHTTKTAELLAEAGANPYLAHAIMTHNSDMNHDLPEPQLKMEKVLFECDEVSGLIQAAAKMRPSGSVLDMPLKSLKKKFKDKRFAAGCDRDVMRLGAEYNGLEMADALNEVLEAMKAIAPVGDIYAKGDEDEAEQAAEPAKKGLTIEPVAEGVTFDVFSQSDMRVVHVKECVAVPKSKKLLQFTLDDGSGQDRTILSGIHDYYEPEDLVGKNVVAIVNIPPRKMMGVESCGMLLSAIHEVDGQERLNLLMVDDAIPAGSKLY
ncbi:MAG: lysine--tRNA ligase [Parafannyhessea umbonata]|uniref:lysine--tRNA ligase n=1 Tax=Parafannyhessea umbonata TaxID=604330 RepID=UPI0026EB3526|nr:lysine--tRNA ligase [Parafannyhessea umbonata]MDD6360064.1 lysine--tRNA ligase [Parafannyhessea umbonata]MDD6601188.1 lysine--tRNA ligase [Parafannyhessea umbonata]